MNAWTKLPAIPGGGGSCLCCGITTDKFAAEAVIAVGFGFAALTRDGAIIWTEPHDLEDEDDEANLLTGARAETIAAQDPDHDWRIVIHGAMRNAVYQRHAAGEWVLIEKGMGFA